VKYLGYLFCGGYSLWHFVSVLFEVYIQCITFWRFVKKKVYFSF
jgi:hypothetical protein